MIEPTEVADYLIELPNRVYRARVSWKMTMRAAAQEIGVHPSTLNRFENTPRANIDLPTIMKILHWLHLREDRP